jgi:SAM-dependent methyltransferase
MDTASSWNQLHNQPRFRPIYPNEHVVRFLSANRGLLEKPTRPRLLDIGFGAGRHIRLATELGFDAFGTDISFSGAIHAQERLLEVERESRIALASFDALPFAKAAFDFAVSVGVFYYGTAEDMKHGIAEAYRVLVPQGKLFAVLRTTEDFRYGKGEHIGHQTYRLTIRETNEWEMILHFLTADDIETYFCEFDAVTFEKTETTTAQRTRLNSDWLITAVK